MGCCYPVRDTSEERLFVILLAFFPLNVLETIPVLAKPDRLGLCYIGSCKLETSINPYQFVGTGAFHASNKLGLPVHLEGI